MSFKLEDQQAMKRRRQETVQRMLKAKIVSNEAKAKADNVWPYADELEIRFVISKGVKYYTIVCGDCGEILREDSIGLLMVDNGLRCTNCYKFHSYQTFLKLQERVHKLTIFNDARIMPVVQPRQQNSGLTTFYDGRVGVKKRKYDLRGSSKDKVGETITRILKTVKRKQYDNKRGFFIG